VYVGGRGGRRFSPSRPSGLFLTYWSTWSTWSAVGSLTSRAGELRSAPSGPDDRDRVSYGLESPSPGGARSQGKGLKVNTGLRGLVRSSPFFFFLTHFSACSECT